MTGSAGGRPPGGNEAVSVRALCRRGAWRFASWWTDVLLMGGAAAGAWALVARRIVDVPWAHTCGEITASSVGLCAGAALPLLFRIAGAWRLGGRLEGKRGGTAKGGMRAQFLLASLHAAGVSEMRCSPEDLRRAVGVAASEATRAARTAAAPGIVAAFIAPVIALVGGLDMVGRVEDRSRMAATLIPSMIVGIAGGLIVVSLIEVFTTVVRGAVERWGASVEMAELTHVAGRPVTGAVIEHASAVQADRDAVESALDGGPGGTVAADDYDRTLRDLTQSG